MIMYFVAKYEKCRNSVLLGGCAQIITILHREGHQNLLQCYMGGIFPIYYNITMNLYYVIYGRPLIAMGDEEWQGFSCEIV